MSMYLERMLRVEIHTPELPLFKNNTPSDTKRMSRAVLLDVRDYVFPGVIYIGSEGVIKIFKQF